MKIPFGIFILFIYICVRLELAACQKKLNLDISAVGLSYFIQDNRKEIPKRYLFSMVEVAGLEKFMDDITTYKEIKDD